MKNKKHEIIIVTIIIVFILLEIILLVKYQYTKNNNFTLPSTNTTSTMNTTNISTSRIGDFNTVLATYPTENDKNIQFSGDILELLNNVDYNSNFKNYKVEKNGYLFTLTCTNYDETESNDYKCKDFKILINDNDYNLYWNIGYGCSVLITDENLIIYQNAFSTDLLVLNNKGQKIFEDTAVINFSVQNDSKEYNIIPLINNNNLYYAKLIEENNVQKVSLTIFDLAKLNIKLSEEVQINIGITA